MCLKQGRNAEKSGVIARMINTIKDWIMSTDPSDHEPTTLASSHEDHPIDASCFNASGGTDAGHDKVAEDADLATGKSEGTCFHSFPAPQFANEPASHANSSGISNHRNNNNSCPSAPVAVRAVRMGQEAGAPACALGEVMSNQQIHIVDHDQDPQPIQDDTVQRTVSVETGSSEPSTDSQPQSGGNGLGTMLAVGAGTVIHGMGVCAVAMGKTWRWICEHGAQYASRGIDRAKVWSGREWNFSASRGASAALGLGVVGLAFGTGLLVNWVYSPIQVSVLPDSRQPVVTTINAAGTQRVLGMNYLVIKSYQDRSTAEKARDQLLRSGIPCTVERGLAGFTGPNWYSVVGLSGFESVGRDARYEQVMSTLREMRFEPTPYKWRQDSYVSVPLD